MVRTSDVRTVMACSGCGETDNKLPMMEVSAGPGSAITGGAITFVLCQECTEELKEEVDSFIVSYI